MPFCSGDYILLFTIVSFVLLDRAKCASPEAQRGQREWRYAPHHNPLNGIPGSFVILPLFRSHINNNSHPRQTTAAADNIRRRQLLRRLDPKTFHARMSLYDDLLSNGYYTTHLFIGSPPQKFSLIVDTGSTVTYVPCSTCERCGKHQDPKFQAELSSSYQRMKCNADCSCDQEREQCSYERHYAEMSSSSGLLGDDLVSFGDESELTRQRIVFGCENSETGDIYSQRADGIMGLGRGQLSVVDQLVGKGVIHDSFSLCFGGMDIGGGAMVFGAFPPPDGMVFAESDPYRSSFYNIDLVKVYVAGKPLNLNPDLFGGKHGTILDSGTTYAYLPEQAFLPFKDAIINETRSLKQIPGPDPNYNDICFSGAGRETDDLSNSFPTLEMEFGNTEKITLSPENYLFRHLKVHGGYCLGIFQNGRDPTTLLGGIIVRNTLVTYDRSGKRVGFVKTNCSELWRAGAPIVRASPNRVDDVPPDIAPVGPLPPPAASVARPLIAVAIISPFLLAASGLAAYIVWSRWCHVSNSYRRVDLPGDVITREQELQPL